MSGAVAALLAAGRSDRLRADAAAGLIAGLRSDGKCDHTEGDLY